ncbi:DUF1878 family protein [Bacillus sp. FJAT-49736]|uniref:DUF1878 family protein n=1 Tax=Bacillus sp. FJAT-49736 TaxID=2833582 RepID=UPI001BC96C89|nr:DUF1878 family protein [Bacillus sp. FJAT-49736]MBS4171896.1 DUF1878 family protein [Bacillus sp. FJAT-49736]
MENFEERLKRMEFYQSLLIQMAQKEGFEFYHLIMENQLTKEDVTQFFELCEVLSHEYEEQKEDKFVFFSPLYEKFKERLHPKLQPNEVIKACINQGLYSKLMNILMKNIN